METVKATSLGVSEPLLRVVYEAIDRALTAVASEQGFVPFSLLGMAAGGGVMTLWACDTADEVFATARLLIAQAGAQYHVLAVHSFITDPSSNIPRTEAVHIEAFE
jgi:hypothetical protein